MAAVSAHAATEPMPDVKAVLVAGAGVSREDLVGVLGKRTLHVGGDDYYCTFGNAEVVCHEERCAGPWSLKGDTVEGSFQCRDEEHQSTFAFRVVAFSSEAIVLEADPSKTVDFPVSGTFVRGPMTHSAHRLLVTSGPATKIIPGSKDRKLFDAVTKFDFFVGEPAKTPRTTSEIWFQDSYEDEAKALARRLEGELGSITPQRWEWGGLYPLIVVVGSQKAPAAPFSK